MEHADRSSPLGGADLSIGYQPTVDLLTGSCTGYEAVPSWSRPHGRPLTGEGFWIFAERFGHGAKAVETIVRMVVADLASARSRGHDAGVRLPVLVQSAADAGYPDLVLAACRASDVPVQRLTVQLVCQIEAPATAMSAATARLHEAGLRVALAEVGANTCGAQMLQLAGLREFTISAFLTRGLDAQPSRVSEIAELLAAADGLGLDVVVDGVETRSQLQILRQLGAHRVQGPLWGLPHPMRDAIRVGGLPQLRDAV